jgi:hypothetical protein
VELRVQALFGLDRHPVIGQPARPLLLSLTSPAGPADQTTADLPAFWRGSWRDVVKDMKGRYPRHRWPDEPWAEARASRPRTRSRLRGGPDDGPIAFAATWRMRGKSLLIPAAIRPKAQAMPARIYQRPKTPCSPARPGPPTGFSNSNRPKPSPDPLMGWAGSGDTQQQVVLRFGSEAEAKAYADRYGIEAHVTPTPPRKLKLQSYADNFR